MSMDWTENRSGRRWQSCSGGFTWNRETGVTNLSGSYIGSGYHIHRGLLIEYGYWRRPGRGKPHEWHYSYAIFCDRKELRWRIAPERHNKTRPPWRLGRRQWALVNDRMGYITSSTRLSELQVSRDRLHTEIAQRLMLDLPAIDTQRQRHWG